MSGTRLAVGRVVALGVLLALSLLLLAASEASAGKYSVAQCGWYVGADVSWSDTTGGAKFRSDGWCVPPPGSDPFDGVHLKSLTRDGQATVSGTRFAAWRWSAPPGTSITQIRGTWWHALHDGFEQRIGGVGGAGFQPFLSAWATDTTPREFSHGFSPGVGAVEDRLLCARGADKACSLDPGSWSALRAVTLTLEDNSRPAPALGGDLVAGGWRHGNQNAYIWGGDQGSGVQLGEIFVDDARVLHKDFPCAVASIGGEWRGTRMQPCAPAVDSWEVVPTTNLSDGPHSVKLCIGDFAGNGLCSAISTLLIDNNPPAHPRTVELAGGDRWRRTNDFDLTWVNPDQAPASPIAGVSWRLSGGGGFDTGPKFASGRDRRALSDITVPGAGEYALQIWLRDEAGNEAASTAVTVPLRLDDVRPTIAFAAGEPAGQLVADVSDPLSGPAKGEIHYRRLGSDEWTELPAKLVQAAEPGAGQLVAPLPDLGYGTFVFRADVVDGAGNAASTTLRADGTQMAIRRVPPPRLPQAKTRLFARLQGGAGEGDSMTVRFGTAALLSGRLQRADGAAVAGREVRVVSHPSKGSLFPVEAQTAMTDEQGEFELRLPAGTSRRVTVSFAGEEGLEPARRPALELRVRSGVSLRARPLELRTGEVLRLGGRVATGGAPLPRRGKLVAIQYLESATHRWRPVLVTRTDHDGRFRARYRFRYVSGNAAVRLRATVLAEEHWPYAPGSSAPVTVRVRG